MIKKSILVCSLMVSFLTQVNLQASEINLPPRGSSMEEVTRLMGEPNEKLDAVGQPPITRWIYTNHTVYFEYSRFLHAVENK